MFSQCKIWIQKAVTRLRGKPLKRKSTPRRWPLIKEFLGFITAALSLGLLLSLVSFDEMDGGINVDQGEIHNWLGPFGAFTSETIFSLIGIWAIFLPFLGGYAALRLLFSIRSAFSVSRFFGLWFVLFAVMPILPMISGNHLPFLVSGVVGEAYRMMLVRYVSVAGVWLWSVTLLFLGLTLVVGRPFLQGALTSAGHAYLWFRQKAKRTTAPVIILEEVEAKPNLVVPVPEIPAGDINIVKREPTQVHSQVPRPALKADSYDLPPLSLLDFERVNHTEIDQAELRREAEKLKAAFFQFGIEGAIREIRPGPVVTNYEFVPAPGIKLSKIAALADDIAMALSAIQVRIVTPIPGKGAVGIEVPNERRETVYLKEIVASPEYVKEPHKLCMAVGKTVEGQPFYMNLANMPHALIAGTTGSGKSVSVNAMICSILFRATPKDVRFLMIDPKMLELSIYKGIPHLLLPPIIDPKKAANALKWAVKEMETRYALMKEAAVRDVDAYNKKLAQVGPEGLNPIPEKPHEHLPYIVVVVDEYADLVMVAGKEVETNVMRLAQKARAAGIHVMLATQRPSVDVVTGVIKANFPVRMGFRLASSHDSKTIVNKTGAEKLLGLGDVLIMPPGTSDLIRVHGAFISEKELAKVVGHWAKASVSEYHNEIANFEETAESLSGDDVGSVDEKFEDAINVVKEYRRCSTSFLQRQLSVGYNRAARIVEQMEKAGLVGPVLNAKGEREIFVE